MSCAGTASSRRPGSSFFANPSSQWRVAFQELLRPPLGKARPSQEQWGAEAVAFPSGRPALLPRALEESALPLVREESVLRPGGADGSCCSVGLGMVEGQGCTLEGLGWYLLGSGGGKTIGSPQDGDDSTPVPALSEAVET